MDYALRSATYGVVQRVLTPRIVVDVEGDVFQGRGLLGEGVEEGVVLPAGVAISQYAGLE